ncbi:MAG: 2-amino-4-hydroxy-6-hydroxymethyldihydropteridine diphosphokinase [Acidobacteria bacterium]|nr:2-amino-4-hydroxy-6-hydroxymethyldihydropteridine diphosphokinase [Acidobacteriota bacterium]
MHYGEQSIAYLSLGSNLGDRAANLLRALTRFVSSQMILTAVSPLYETEPVDYSDQPEFLNMAIAVTGFSGDPFSLLKFCLETERELGRVRTIPRGARIIDIDLLMFGDQVIDDASHGVNLTLPHPRMHLRRFVMTPMKDIAPLLRHPLSGHTMSEILDALEDSSSVRIYRD